MSVSCWSINI